MPRQAVKGTLIIVSNRERAVFESQLSALKPQYLIWTSPDTPRDQIEMPPAGLAMVVFLIQTSPEGVTIDPSWGQDLPVSASEISKAGMMIAAKTIHPPGNAVPKWYASMAISAPNEKLLRVNFAEAMRLEDFPLNKPIVRDVLDLRRFRSIACLPLQTEGYYGPINTAAEAALYRALVDLRVFNVVGRESLSLPAPGGSVAGARARDLGRELNVDALAYVDITGAETNCEDQLRGAHQVQEELEDRSLNDPAAGVRTRESGGRGERPDLQPQEPVTRSRLGCSLPDPHLHHDSRRLCSDYRRPRWSGSTGIRHQRRDRFP